MSSDKSDKTVFRQTPVERPAKIDATIIRPTPGRRSGQTQTQHTTTSSRQTRDDSGIYPSQRQTTDYQEPVINKFNTNYGLNPLVNTASMLIAVFYKTRQSVSHSNVGGLHRQLVSAIRQFEETARSKAIKPEIVLSARYILCAALDEAVLNTPWGAESAWTQRTLLSMFHNETNGGEKFFALLERVNAYPAENLEILELMYILLSLGFEGKYRVISRGRDKIEQIRDELYKVLRRYRGDYEKSLSSTWSGLGKTKNSLAHYVPLWVISSIVVGILVVSYSGFRYWLHQSTEHAASQLNAIALSDSTRDTPKK